MPRRTLLVVLVVVVVLAAGGGWFAYALMRRGDQPPPVVLASASPSGAAAEVVSSADFAGNWVVDGSGESFVGYRVLELLVFRDAPSDAVGRTTAVQGTMTVNNRGTQVTQARITADMTRLSSDNATRDRVLKGFALETEEFPEATFVLTSPIALAPDAATGEEVNAQILGDLTVHGVTRSISLTIQARALDPDTIEVVGSAPVLLTDFGMRPPAGGTAVSVLDEGTFEFQVRFVRG
jgi:polyisoprenoid-binding protein YceI